MEWIILGVSFFISTLTVGWAITLIEEKIKFQKALQYSAIYLGTRILFESFASYLKMDTLLTVVISLALGGASLFVSGKYIFKDKEMNGGTILWIIILGGILLGAVSKGIWAIMTAVGLTTSTI